MNAKLLTRYDDKALHLSKRKLYFSKGFPKSKRGGTGVFFKEIIKIRRILKSETVSNIGYAPGGMSK